MKTILQFTFLLLLATVLARAAEPSLIPFQGRLTDQQGVPYTNGQFTILFQLYDQAVGGSSIWQERHEKVGVINGMVNVFLGSISALDGVSFTNTKHLGITVDADNNPNTPDPEMVPRQMIIPAFWAKNSDKLAGYDWSAVMVGGTNNPVSGQIRGDKLQTQGITAAQIAPQTITASQIASNTITSSQLINGIIGSNQIAANAIGNVHLSGGAINLTNLAPRAVGTNVGIGGIAISPIITRDLGSANSGPSNIVELAVQIVSSGRPVMLSLASTEGSSSIVRGYTITANGRIFYAFRFSRNNVGISRQSYSLYGFPNGDLDSYLPPEAFHFLDFPAAGTNTYTVQFDTSGTTGVGLTNVRFIAYEL